MQNLTERKDGHSNSKQTLDSWEYWYEFLKSSISANCDTQIICVGFLFLTEL